MLTSVLRDSLGGNCMTTMIATLAVEKRNLDVSTVYLQPCSDRIFYLIEYYIYILYSDRLETNSKVRVFSCFFSFLKDSSKLFPLTCSDILLPPSINEMSFCHLLNSHCFATITLFIICALSHQAFSTLDLFLSSFSPSSSFPLCTDSHTQTYS